MPGKIFISYTSRDREWAHWIGVTLRENGFVPLVHEWEIGAGENIARWMDESLAASNRLLGVFTDAYAKALYSSSERWSAYWDDAGGRKGFLVPVEVEHVTSWPPLTRALNRVSLIGLSEVAAEHALLAFLEPPKSPTTRPPFPGGVAPKAKGSATATTTASTDRGGESLPVKRPPLPTASRDVHVWNEMGAVELTTVIANFESNTRRRFDELEEAISHQFDSGAVRVGHIIIGLLGIAVGSAAFAVMLYAKSRYVYGEPLSGYPAEIEAASAKGVHVGELTWNDSLTIERAFSSLRQGCSVKIAPTSAETLNARNILAQIVRLNNSCGIVDDFEDSQGKSLPRPDIDAAPRTAPPGLVMRWREGYAPGQKVYETLNGILKITEGHRMPDGGPPDLIWLQVGAGYPWKR